MNRFTIIVFILVCADALSAQHQSVVSETVGNYSGIHLGMLSRSGLRSGWNSIPDTMGARSSDFVLLATVLVPVAGDITESPTFALGLEIPYLSKQFVQHSRQASSQIGIGDINVVGRYGFTFYKESETTGRRHALKGRADLIGKIKLPHIEDGRMNGQGDVDQVHLQLGSGSADGAFGFAFLTETENYFMVHGHAMYWLHTMTEGKKAGNSLDYELLLLLATLPLPVEPVGTFLPALGIKGMHRARDKSEGALMEDSGGDALTLSIGIQSLWNYLPVWGTFFMVEASYHKPVVQRVNGVQMGYGSSFSIGTRIYIK